MIAEKNYLDMSDGLGAEESSWSITQKFWNMWNDVKSKLKSILGMDTKINENQRRYMALYNNKKLTSEQMVKVKEGLARGDSHRSLWRQVKDKIEAHLPSWMKTEKESSAQLQSAHASTLQGLGWIPVVIGVASITALAFVASKGLSLLKEVHTESRIISDLEQGLITTSQASQLSRSFKPVSSSLISVGGSTSILLLAVAAGAAFLFWKMK